MPNATRGYEAKSMVFMPPLANDSVGEEFTIKELAEIAKGVVIYMGEIILDTFKPDGTPRELMDTFRLTGMSWPAKAILNSVLAEACRDLKDRYG